MKQNKVIITNWLIGVLSISSIVYVALRAHFIGPYQDEITTFFWYAKKGDINPFHAHLDANNHVLNSLFIHISYLLFGTKLFFLRLPNILAFIIFCYYLFKISQLIKSQLLRFSLFITFLASIFFISFFSIARGYGISYAFLLGTFYFLLRIKDEYREKYLVYGLIFLSLSLWANLSLLLTSLPIFFAYVFYFIKSKPFSKISYLYLLIYIVPVYFAIDFALLLKNNGSLYLGIEGDFLFDAIMPLLFNLFYSFKIAYALLFIGGIGAVYLILFKRKSLLKSNAFILFFILFSSVMGIYLSFYILGVGYPVERALLHIGVLFIVYLFFILDEFNLKLVNYLALILPLFLVVFFFKEQGVNLTYIPIWRETTFHKSFFDKIDYNSENQPLIYGAGPINKSLNHYNVTDDFNYNVAQEGSKVSDIADYLILFNYKTDYNREKYVLLDSNTFTGVKLLRRNEKVSWIKFHELEIDSLHTKNQYPGFFEIDINPDSIGSFRNEIEFNCLTKNLKDNVWIVYILKNKNGETLHYNSYSVDRLFNNLNQDNFNKSFFIEDVSKDATVLNCYIWNIKGEDLFLTDIKIKNFHN